jgi:hypothetical protein
MTSNDHFEPDSLSQVQAALVRVQESADAFRRVARGNSVETVAKSAADPRLIELLKLVEELPNRDVNSATINSRQTRRMRDMLSYRSKQKGERLSIARPDNGHQPGEPSPSSRRRNSPGSLTGPPTCRASRPAYRSRRRA